MNTESSLGHSEAVFVYNGQHIVVNKGTAFIERFSDLWPLKVLHIFCPPFIHIHTPTAVSTMQGAGQLIGSRFKRLARHFARRSRGSNQQPSEWVKPLL